MTDLPVALRCTHVPLLLGTKGFCQGIYIFINSGATCVVSSRAKRVISLLKGNSRPILAEHTHIDVSHIETHDRKFLNLTVDSRLEIAFAGRPKGFNVPNFKFYN